MSEQYKAIVRNRQVQANATVCKSNKTERFIDGLLPYISFNLR